MMFFFDYLYFQCCNYYKGHKDEQALDMWRISAIIIVALSTALVIASMTLLGYQLFIKNDLEPKSVDMRNAMQFYLTITSLVIFILLWIIFGIRYNKFITYEKIVDKVRELSDKRKMVLHILVFIYLCHYPYSLFLQAVSVLKYRSYYN